MTSKTAILYVDDEPINLKLFELNFRSKYSILTASGGFEGLEILKNTPKISIVISDMKMPRMNGLEFIATAKKTFPNITYFILTGYDITDEINEAITTNLIDKYFRKPFNFKEINNAIVEAIS